RIAVKKEYRGQSIGSNIIRMMEDEIVAHHINEAILNAQTHATSLYESLGYKVFSEQFMDAGIPHVSMVKKLNKKIQKQGLRSTCSTLFYAYFLFDLVVQKPLRQ